jgi:hypothetical protein
MQKILAYLKLEIGANNCDLTAKKNVLRACPMLPKVLEYILFRSGDTYIRMQRRYFASTQKYSLRTWSVHVERIKNIFNGFLNGTSGTVIIFLVFVFPKIECQVGMVDLLPE